MSLEGTNMRVENSGSPIDLLACRPISSDFDYCMSLREDTVGCIQGWLRVLSMVHLLYDAFFFFGTRNCKAFT
jgi:hypothetical protein